MSNLALRDGDRFLFMGDSITDCGRRDANAPWGNGYAAMTIGLIQAEAPGLQVEFFNRGIGGNTTAELEARWQEDCLDLRPTWLSVLIGINDCFQYINGREETSPEHYGARYETLLGLAVEATGCGLVLLEPFLFVRPEDLSDGHRQGWELLPRYIETVHRLAEQFGARLVTTHQIGQEILQYYPGTFLAPEPVHPNTTGHVVIAHHLVQALRE